MIAAPDKHLELYPEGMHELLNDLERDADAAEVAGFDDRRVFGGRARGRLQPPADPAGNGCETVHDRRAVEGLGRERVGCHGGPPLMLQCSIG